MEITPRVAERVASGSFYLTVGQITAILLGVVFSVIFARILGPENYGLVSFALIYPSLLISLTDLGLGGIVSRFATIPSTRRDIYVWSGVVLRLMAAVIGGGVIYYLAGVFAHLLQRPYLEAYIRVLALYTVSASLLGILYGVFAGLGEYTTSALIFITQYFLKGVVGITLLYMGLGAYGVILSYSIAYSLLAVIFLVKLAKKFRITFSIRESLEMLTSALPLYGALICDVVLGPLLNTILAKYISNYEQGNYAVALSVLVPLNALSGSIGTALLTSMPLLSENPRALRESANELVFYGATIFSGMAFLYVSILTPLVNILYGQDYWSAPAYAVALSASIIVPVVLGSLVIGNYFITIKTTHWNAVTSITRLLITVSLAYTFIPVLRIYGVASALLVGNLASTIVGYCILARVYGTRVNLKRSVKASIPAFVSFVITYLVLSLVKQKMLCLIVGFTTYTTLYLLLIPLFMEIRDIRNIVSLTTRLEYIGVLISKLAPYYLKLVSAFSKR